MSIATKMPLPASAVAAPKDVNSPVPTIIAAVSSTAVIFPRVLVLERTDLDVAEGVIWLLFSVRMCARRQRRLKSRTLEQHVWLRSRLKIAPGLVRHPHREGPVTS